MKQQQLRSDVEGQAPLPVDLVEGELAVNLHVNSPALYLKDTVGTVRKIAGSGSQSLDDLTDCDTTAIPPTTGDSLIFDGTNFVPQVSASSPIGGASLAYEFEDNTAMANPGDGDWRADDVDLNAATQLAINKTTRRGNDASVVWDNINAGDYLGIWEERGSRDSVSYLINGVTDNGTWLLLDVAGIPGPFASMNNNADTEIFIIDDPANKLPAGGDVGDVLMKDSTADYDVGWSSRFDSGSY